MTVVVGYVPTETEFSAVAEAERQARCRDVPVVIVNVGGRGGITRPHRGRSAVVGAAGYRVLTAADQPISTRWLPI
jgi:hypothetical protein